MKAVTVQKKEVKYSSVIIYQVSNGYMVKAGGLTPEERRAGYYDNSETFVFNTPQELAAWVQQNATRP